MRPLTIARLGAMGAMSGSGSRALTVSVVDASKAVPSTDTARVHVAETGVDADAVTVPAPSLSRVVSVPVRVIGQSSGTVKVAALFAKAASILWATVKDEPDCTVEENSATVRALIVSVAVAVGGGGGSQHKRVAPSSHVVSLSTLPTA